ncbi:MAG: hypothetical protein ABFD89_03740 [Bryobacteraceae bacterium]
MIKKKKITELRAMLDAMPQSNVTADLWRALDVLEACIVFLAEFDRLMRRADTIDDNLWQGIHDMIRDLTRERSRLEERTR